MRASRLYFPGRNSPPVACGSVAATAKRRKTNILTLSLYLGRNKRRNTTNTKPTTLRGWCSHKIKWYFSMLSRHLLFPSLLSSLLPAPPPPKAQTLKLLKYRHAAWPNTPLPPPPPPPSGKTEWEKWACARAMRMEEAGWASSRWSPDVVALGTGHSSAVKGDSELHPSPFSFHRSSSPFSDRSHLAWQREWSTKSQPSQVWPLCATQRSARVNKMHAHTCTKYLLPTSPQPPKAVTWLLTHRSCSPAVLHYDKYTGVMGVLSTRSQPSDTMRCPLTAF